MSARALASGLVVLAALCLASACQFQPDLSRYQDCAEDGTCAAGFTCLEEERICLPDCGFQCTPEPPDASTDGGMEDGGTGDGGTGNGDMGDGGTGDGGLGNGGTGDGGGVDTGPDAGEPLSLVTTGLPPATETEAYSVTPRARGGTPPYTFSLTGQLPQGITFGSGVFSGTPTTAGTAYLTLQVKDQGSPSATLTTPLELRVRPLLRIAGPGILVNGYVNKAYAEQISVTGGTPPYVVSLASGNAPPGGLTLATTGGVTGMPSPSGQYVLQVRVTDSDSEPQMAGRDLDLKVQATPLLIAWATRSVPDGRVGTPYHYVMKVGGVSSATWKLEAGSTPPGIGFDASTATLRGTPTHPGVYSFTISATNLGKVSQTFTLTVY